MRAKPNFTSHSPGSIRILDSYQLCREKARARASRVYRSRKNHRKASHLRGSLNRTPLSLPSTSLLSSTRQMSMSIPPHPSSLERIRAGQSLCILWKPPPTARSAVSHAESKRGTRLGMPILPSSGVLTSPVPLEGPPPPGGGSAEKTGERNVKKQKGKKVRWRVDGEI
ncbi:hypothetical protein QTJ16_006567 [Diplocarpon rosae]|uniref:Uncharacterized protein n=1 Tax=Diplocarpon rosae TaxID=946125 RepID=A0AAD9SSN2_9HELO|nr:hypothetical protein QTJ16_006567 [Diplocarpon rosae]